MKPSSASSNVKTAELRLFLLLCCCVGTWANPTFETLGSLAVKISWTDSVGYSSYVVRLQPPASPLNLPLFDRGGILQQEYVANISTIGFHIDTNRGNGPLTTAWWFAGELYSVYIFGSNDGGATYPSGQLIGSQQYNLVGVSDAPANLAFCAFGDSASSPCSGEVQLQNSVRVTWEEPSNTGGGAGNAQLFADIDISQYTLQAATDPFFNATVIESVYLDTDNLITAYVFQFQGLARGVTYFVRVLAITPLGESPWSNTLQLPLIVQAPSAPSLVSVSSGTIGGSYLEVLISRPSDSGDESQFGLNLTKYTVQISNTSNFASIVVGGNHEETATQAATQSIVVRLAALQSGVMYFVRVRAAHGEFGYDLYGNFSNVMNHTIVGAPGAVDSMLLSVTGPLQLNLSWTEPSNKGWGEGVAYPLVGFQYSLYSSPSLGPDSGTIYDVGVDEAYSVHLSGLVQGQVYYASVRAQNDAEENGGFGPWYNVSAAECSSAPIHNRSGSCGVVAISFPSAVQALSVVGFAPELEVNWSRPLDTGSGGDGYPLLKYEVLVAGRGGGAGTYEVSELIESYQRGGFTPGTVSRVYVRALNQVGPGPWVNGSYRALLRPSAPELTVEATEAGGVLANASVSLGSPRNTGLGPDNASWPLLALQLRVVALNLTNGGPAACAEPHLVTLAPSTSNATIEDLTKGCTYAIIASGVNEAGVGEGSRAVTTLVFQSGPPSNISAVSGNQTVDVTWSVPHDTGHGFGFGARVLSYQLDAAFVPTFNKQVLATLTDIDPLSPTVQLRSAFCAPINYRIRAVTAVGAGVWSEVRTALPYNCTVEIAFFCTAGFYLDSTVCRPCPTFSTSPDLSEFASNCTCAPGYTGSDPASCTACSAGKYKELAGPWACSECPQNSTTAPATALLSNCSCVPGFTGPGGAVLCEPCQAGSFKAATGSAECTLCPANTFLEHPAAVSLSQCHPCPSNSSSPPGSALQINCSCIAGSSGPFGGPCELCGAGKYKAEAGSDNCTACPDGTFREERGGTAELDCQACPQLSAALDGGTKLDDCLCVPGAFGPGGGPLCATCPSGLFTDQYNSTACRPCNVSSCAADGTFREACPGDRDAACTACTNGPFDIVYTSPGTAVASNDCEWACAPGYYNLSATACAKCEEPCAVGQYLLLCECVPCTNWKPEGATYSSAGTPLGFNQCEWTCDAGEVGRDAESCEASCRV